MLYVCRYMKQVESNGVLGESPLTSPTRSRANAQPAQGERLYTHTLVCGKLYTLTVLMRGWGIPIHVYVYSWEIVTNSSLVYKSTKYNLCVCVCGGGGGCLYLM